jgi:restriction system protein
MIADLRAEIQLISGTGVTITPVFTSEGTPPYYGFGYNWAGKVLSFKYKLDVCHRFLNMKKEFQAQDDFVVTADNLRSLPPAGSTQLSFRITQWQSLATAVLAQVREWDTQWDAMLTEFERDQDAVLADDEARQQVAWWRKHKLGELEKEVMALSIGASRIRWRSFGPFATVIQLSNKTLQKQVATRGLDLFELAERVLHVAEQWAGVANDTPVKSPSSGRDSAILEKKTRVEQGKALAAARTNEAQAVLSGLQSTLTHALGRGPRLNWDRLEVRSGFRRPSPDEWRVPRPDPNAQKYQPPPRPDANWAGYGPQFSLLDWIFPSRKQFKLAESRRVYDGDLDFWLRASSSLASQHEADLKVWQGADNRYARTLAYWQASQRAFSSYLECHNTAVSALRSQYEAGDKLAVVPYCELVLANSDYPGFIPREWEVDFNPETGILVVDLGLPAPQDLPTIKDVKYVQSTDALVEKHLSEAEQTRLYDDLVYQILLRSIHELLDADRMKALSAVVINGFVRSVDKATGKDVTACIASVQADRGTFAAINLARVDPKLCFKQLRGVAA